MAVEVDYDGCRYLSCRFVCVLLVMTEMMSLILAMVVYC